jgi:eukaryotic-like serine/threonine-protein kinase
VDAADVLGGRYRLEERLGEGGMSVVWRAHDEVLRRPVAVKLLSARFLADWASRQRIRAEAQAVARLSHPHVAGVYDYGESEREDLERVPYVVMELLSGPSLAHVLTTAGPPPVPTALRICAEVASALAAAHEQGIVHRDVKPANVILTPTGSKVVDFGVAAAIGDLSEHHPDAVMYGTPAYLAPERLEGGPVVTGTDVYALGLMVYRVLTGTMPWSAETTTQMLHAHMYVEPEPLPRLPDVPRAVTAICQRCLCKDPADRPSAVEVARVLARSAGVSVPVPPARDTGSGDETTAARRAGSYPAVPGWRRPAKNRRRVAARISVAGALALSVTALAIVVSLRWSTADPGGTVPQAGGPGAAQAGEVPPTPSGPSGSANAKAGEVDPDDEDRGVDPAPTGQLPTSSSSSSEPPAASLGNSAATVPQTPVHTATFEATGGTVLAQCTGTVAELLSWAPKQGWAVKDAPNAGPADTVQVTFRQVASDSTAAPGRSSIRVRCVDGFPSERIR